MSFDFEVGPKGEPYTGRAQIVQERPQINTLSDRKQDITIIWL